MAQTRSGQTAATTTTTAVSRHGRTLPESYEFVLAEILEQPMEGNIRRAFDLMQCVTISDIMDLKSNDLSTFTGTITIPDVDDPTIPVVTTITLKPLEVTKILRVQQWFACQEDPTDTLWATLTKPDYIVWRTAFVAQLRRMANAPKTATTTPTATARSELGQFLTKVKINISDYSKFTDDKLFRKWDRQIHSIAYLHGTSDVLDHNFVPATLELTLLFGAHQKFMYTMFCECVLTQKGKLYVRAHENDQDAQKIFTELCAAYEDSVSSGMAASALRSELLLLRLDERWKKSLESFFVFWSNKVIDLENIEGNLVPEAEKRLWLTNTLQSSPVMDTAVKQAITTEIVTQKTSGKSSTPLDWSTFYDLLVTIAKFTDDTSSKNSKFKRAANTANFTPGRGGAGRGTGRGGRNTGRGDRRPGRGSSRGTPYPPPNTKFVSQTQTMTADMTFSTKDWWLLSPSQRATVEKLRKERRDAPAKGGAPVTTLAANTAQQTPGSASMSTLSAQDQEALVLGNHVRNVLSTQMSSYRAAAIQGANTRNINMANIQYNVSQHAVQTLHNGSLLDGGANGGMSGNDVVVLETTLFTADVTGIADSVVSNVPIVTCAGLVTSTDGPIIVLMNQYAHHGKGRTIHSVLQLKHFGVQVDETPRQLGGKQRIRTSSGHVVPLSIRNGLAYMDMSPPTPFDMESYPHVMLTSDSTWNPIVFDDEYLVEDVELEEGDTIPDYGTDRVNDFGQILNRTSAQLQLNINLMDITNHFDTDPEQPVFEAYVDQCINDVCDYRYEYDTPFEDYVEQCLYIVHNHTVALKQHDFNRLKPNFAFPTTECLKHTLKHTTQYARGDTRIPMRKHFHTRFPAANVPRWNDDVAMDTKFSNVPAHDDGIAGHGGTEEVQLYCGVKSLLTDVFEMKTESAIVGTFEDLIRRRGAPNSLRSDNAKAQTCKAVAEVLRMYAIADYQCEPHYQHQNPAERRIQQVQKVMDMLMDKTATPASMWLLCLKYVVYVQNHLAMESLGWLTPLEVATGQQPDVSALMMFRWWEPVYYSAPKTFPSESRERLGRWVGVAEHQGDALTYLVLDDKTHMVVTRSQVRSALNPDHPNLRAETVTDGSSPDYGEVQPAGKPILLSASQISPDGEPPRFLDSSELKLPKFSPDELMGLTFIRELEDGQKVRAKIVRKIITREDQAHKKLAFQIELGDSGYDEIMGYHELCEIVEAYNNAEQLEDMERAWIFKAIVGHEGPMNTRHPDYKGSLYNVLVQWEDGSETYEALDMIRKDDPISLAKYAAENNLLDTNGWKKLRRYAKNQKKLDRMLRQSNLASIRRGKMYMFGVQVPRSDREADELDARNGNHKWKEAREAELRQLDEYKTFKDAGIGARPDGYKKINVRIIYSVKHDLRHKARLVAGGHLTDPSQESNYSGVVALRSIRICMLVAELNNMITKVADVGNAYLEAYTKEKVYFIAGPSFGALAGHALIIVKALYGLRSSGARFHEKFADTLRDMGYTPCKADPDVWIKDCDTHYEYVCVYVDDLMVMGKDPDKFFKILTDVYGYKLKGVGDPAYHLGGNFFRDQDGTLAWGAKSYVEKMIGNYQVMFGEKPKEYSCPLDKNDHPELDVTELLSGDGIVKYQSLIGALQWAITLGRFDILIAVCTMSTYRVAPRTGHMERLKRMHGYLKRNLDAAIRFRTEIPNHEAAGMPKEYDWEQTVYGGIHEELPGDMPVPKGKPVRITTYEDANLMHDLVTGRSMTGILHLLNQTPIHWYSRKQGSVETATYGSEFVAAKIATEQIMDLKYTLRMMGVPLDGPAWMFGDNQSVLTSANIPHSSLNKRHNALAYHRVREAISAKVLYFLYVPSKKNAADIFTKFLPWVDFWPLVQPLLFWKGETMKHVDPRMPLSELVAFLKESVDGLRGVTRGTDGSVVNPTTDLSGVEVKVKDTIESQVVTSTDEFAESQVVNLQRAVSQLDILTLIDKIRD